MCAAPGSKVCQSPLLSFIYCTISLRFQYLAHHTQTAQILEALNPHHTSSTGLLIANDTDYKRTHMLVHQTGRMPSKGLMVTNCDACEFFASTLTAFALYCIIWKLDRFVGSRQSIWLTISALFPHISLGDEGDLRFDRILADVP